MGRFRLQVVPQVIAETCDAEKHYGDVELVPVIFEHLHIFTEFDAHPGQEIAPDQRADKGEDREHHEVGFQYARWKRDESADNRQHTADEEDDITVLCNPLVS